MCQLCNDCLQTKMPQPLIRALGEAFTQPAILARSFQSKVRDSEKNCEQDKEKGMSMSSPVSIIKTFKSKTISGITF